VARRPGIFVLLFWSALTAALLTRIFDPLGEGPRFGPWAVGAAALALVAAWLALPWDRRSDARHKLLALGGFVGAAFALCHTTSLLWSLPLYAIAVADGVFLFGFRPGVAVAAVTVAVAFAGGYLYGPPAAAPPESGPPAGAITVAAFLAGTMVPVAAFVLGICKALVDSERNREEARRLLAELDRANAELRRQASTVRALAIAEERARMAREVHDSVGHHLTAIHLQLQNAERFGDRDPERARSKVRAAREATLAALAEVRRSVRALKPPALDERSGVAALLGLARSFDGAGPAVSFDVEGEEQVLSEEAELVLYRATQEGLTNAAKHSGAKRLRVRLSFAPEATRLVVADDGAGARDGTPADGFGLAALGERVTALGGTLVAGNRPEGGFALRVELPRAPAEAGEARDGYREEG
jgi:signal transduction histidine kinase